MRQYLAGGGQGVAEGGAEMQAGELAVLHWEHSSPSPAHNIWRNFEYLAVHLFQLAEQTTATGSLAKIARNS